MNKLICTFILISWRFQMKILKILLILLIPALGIVGCKKSETKPKCTAAGTVKNSDNSNSNVAAGRSEGASVGDSGTPVDSPIIGAGDDDRDGGDKKHKK
jgi:hypothetical protein